MQLVQRALTDKDGTDRNARLLLVCECDRNLFQTPQVPRDLLSLFMDHEPLVFQDIQEGDHCSQTVAALAAATDC